MNSSSPQNSQNKSFADWLFHQYGQRVSKWLTNARLDQLGLIVFCGFLIVLFAVNLIKPEYNWDMAAYLASALQDDSLSNQALHSKVWELMKANAGDAQYYRLTAGNPYNLYNFQNPDAFVSMLPMYDVKAGYVGLIKYTGQIIGPVKAVLWISILSSLAVGLICLYWMKRQDFLQAAPIVVAIILLSDYFHMGRIVTPDLLVAAFFLLGCERFLRGKDWWAVGLFFLAFSMRPDIILFLFALLLAMLIFNDRKLPAITGFVAAIGAYLWITTDSSHPGWWVHFYFTNIEIQNTLIGFDPDFTVLTYLKGIGRGVLVSLNQNNWPMMLALMLMAWAYLQKSGIITNRRSTALMVAILLCIGGKFIVFPLPDDRTFMPFIVAFAMVLLETWKPQFRKAL